MVEEWKPICGFEGLYNISNHGNVYSLVSDKQLKLAKGKRGYFTIRIYKDRKGHTLAVHRLVALAFMENVENKRCVNHIDGNKRNNTLSNLEWATDSENSRHAYATGLMSDRFGTNNGCAKINDEIALEVKLLMRDGVNCLEISRRLNISHHIVYGIKKGGWKHVTIEGESNE